MTLSHQLTKLGRREDHASRGGEVVHVSKPEVDLLEELTGNTSTNPDTGLRQFFFAGGPSFDVGDFDINTGEATVDAGDYLAAWTDAMNLGAESLDGKMAAARVAAEAQAKVEGFRGTGHRSDTAMLVNDLVLNEREAAVITNMSKSLGRTPTTDDIPFGYSGDFKFFADQVVKGMENDIIRAIPGISQDRLDAMMNEAINKGFATMPGNTMDNFVESRQEAFSGIAETVKRIEELKRNDEGLRDEERRAEMHKQYAKLNSLLQAQGVSPGDVTLRDNPVAQVLRGDAKEMFNLNNPFNPGGGMETGLSILPVAGLGILGGNLLGAATGTTVVVRFSDPVSGMDFNVHEDGSITPANYEYAGQFNEGSGFGAFSQPRVFDPILSGGEGFDRSSALDAILQDLIGNQELAGFRPNLDELDRNAILQEQLFAANDLLGEDIGQAAFDQAFSSPFLGEDLLLTEEGQRKDAFSGQLGNIFTGEAFSLDDEIINSIVQERATPAREQISRTEARGNLNPFGGQTANEAITTQTPGVTERVREIGESVLGGNQRDVDVIRETAQGQIGNFQLGDDLFDVSPFATQRQSLIDERTGGLRGDITSAIGGIPLFDVRGAIQGAGRTQGVVSGPTNNAVLDVLADRERVSGTDPRNRRSLGSRGSGAF